MVNNNQKLPKITPSSSLISFMFHPVAKYAESIADCEV